MYREYETRRRLDALMIHGRDIQEGLLVDAAQSSPPIDIRFTVDNPDIIHRVQEFHRNFAEYIV